MKYSRLDIDAVESAADIRDIYEGLKGTGASRYCRCPQCGKEGKQKGLIVTHKRHGGKYINLARCFSCGYTVKGAIDAYQQQQGVGFLEAVEQLASQYNVTLVPVESKRSSASSSYSDKIKKSFAEMQLFASGLEPSDVMVRVPIKGTDDYRFECPFRKGGADFAVRNLNESDDEMLIYYYDLDGNPMTFSDRKSPGKLRPYVRVRWSNPDLHTGSDDRPIKYQSPKGAPCTFYIPQYIRDAYAESRQIETLVIQEGEKKAEKACKHGIPSLGIQGIYNIGSAESGLIKELQYIVRKCAVKNVVLLMDSDWDNLHQSVKPGDHIDQRPNQFAKAVIKFKTYVATLHKLGLAIDVYFGHINHTEKGEKGIDDLLVGSLHLHESELKADMDAAILSHDGIGKWVSIHKISTKTDFQIRDFWKLNSRAEFFEKYREQIESLGTFRFGRITYVFEDGKFREAVRNAAESNFWTVTIDEEKHKKTVDFKYRIALDFLEANEFHKIHTADLKIGEYKFVKIDDFIISECSGSQIRDFVYDYVVKSTKDDAVLDMFIAKLANMLGSDKLERLSEIQDSFRYDGPMLQNFFYKNAKITVTDEGIQESPVSECIWEDVLIKREFRRLPIFKFIDKDEKGFYFDLTDEGKKSEFMRFIINVSNFWKGRQMTQEDDDIFNQHIVNKITSIGFLLNSWKPRSEQICIVGMDARMDEVGSSNGRSGKSLIGFALNQMLDVQTIDCKKVKNDDDFIYSLVTPKTRIVFLDDTRVNFDFENFYSALTGDLQINPKQGCRFQIKYEVAPKFYITTNHALNDQSESGKDRRVMMAFSNYYSKNFSPADDFGHLLFDEWDAEQWNLFDNLMLECVMYYFRSYSRQWNARKGRGVVPPPMQQLERRAMRQIMGEAFFSWAEAYFDKSGCHLNARIGRKEMSDEYHKTFPSAKESIRAADFRRRMIAYCKFKGFHMNASQPSSDGDRFGDWRQSHQGESFIGEGYKSNSVEYWRICTDEFAKAQPW